MRCEFAAKRSLFVRFPLSVVDLLDGTPVGIIILDTIVLHESINHIFELNMEGFMVVQHIPQINNEIVADGFGKQLDSSRGEIVILPNILATECWDIDGDIR